MKKTLLLILILITWPMLYAQQISHMQTRFTGCNVEVAFTVTTDEPRNIELLYSTDNGATFRPCRAVKGDLLSQSSGDKKIVWECVEDGVVKADVVLKISFVSNIEMVLVEGGTFTMGCTKEQDRDCNEKAHQVTLNSFYIGKYEVTQKQWKDVMGNNPSSSYQHNDNMPVTNVSWNDAQIFINKLNAQTGKQYRLPTEAEWEYAAKGGKKSKGFIYSGSNTIDEVAWYRRNSGVKLQAVGTKQPNELGIYDMSGNVREWCNDWYDRNYYDKSPQANPPGPASGSERVVRDGSFDHGPSYSRTAYRYGDSPGKRIYFYGFRLALSQ